MRSATIKRLFDVFFAATGLLVSLPLWIVIVILIKACSRGPALYKQERVGRLGRPFTIYKFRTMVIDADKRGPLVTVASDQRITPIGRFLRKTKLDELPQLLNVLKGDMSWVGPRPEVPRYVNYYSNRERCVLQVRPGITDLATVYYRNEGELLSQAPDKERFYISSLLPKKLELNLLYVENISLILDLKIILVTILVVLIPSADVARSLVQLRTDRSWQTMQRGQSMRLYSKGGQILVDIGLAAASLVTAYLLRFAGMVPAADATQLLVLMPYIILLRFFVNYLYGIYNFIWRYISLSEAIIIVKSVGTVSLLLLALRLLLPDSLRFIRVPISIVLIDFMQASISLIGARLVRRMLYEANESKRHKTHAQTERVLLIGAGQAGVYVAKEAKQHRDLGWNILGFVDDDPAKYDTSIMGIRVLGSTHNLPQLVKGLQIDKVIITIANAASKDIRRIVTLCDEIPVKVKIIPSFFEILEGKVRISKIRDVDINDLLGRDVVAFDSHSSEVTTTYRDKRVLITGAGGSIGSELCRQITQVRPRELLMLDKDENGIFEISLELRGKSDGSKINSVVADILNVDRLRHVFETFKPNVIFHAAAYKHVPLLEQNPSEAILNNVIGTKHLIELAHEYNVETFVLISTDKAVNPCNVLGASKRLAEMIVQDMARKSNVRCSCVRFGNVLASRGSVIPIFKKQMENGGPITVTHPDATRYFMTIPESVQLIIQAGAIGQQGEICILDMGQPVKIVDLARDLIRLSGLKEGEDIAIKFVGLRPGEKLFEELSLKEEEMVASRFKKIFIAKPLYFDPGRLALAIDLLRKLSMENDNTRILQSLTELGLLSQNQAPGITSGMANGGK